MSSPQDTIKAIRNEIMPRKNTPEENKELCKKYSFLSWYGDPLYVGYSEDKVEYNFTWEDELPEGWRIAFCPQIWDELKTILEKANYVNDFRFAQIKEKYGTLRLYHCGVPEEIFEEICAWESKYDKLSENVCIHCGKPATYMTTGWITFICEDCLKEYQGRAVPIEDIDTFYEDPEAYWKNKK